MKIAVAMTSNNHVYHSNPCTAPKFGIYTIKKEGSNVSFALSAIFENPIFAKNDHHFTDEEKNCNCSIERQQDFNHACEHYALLDIIGGSSYLLADKFCKNTQRSLVNGGISIYKVPPIVREVNIAIKNFLLGANYAHTVQHIYHAS